MNSSRRPSPALIVACLALFVSLGGTAFALAGTIYSADIVDGEVKSPDIAKAAVLATHIRGNAVLSSHVRDDTLKGSDIDESTLGLVPEATYAGNAQSALEAGHAETANYAGNAQAAENADKLDMLDSTDFLKTRSCQRGKVLGFARINAQVPFPATYTSSATYVEAPHNCTGQPVEARLEPSTGNYFVRFSENGAVLALVTLNGTPQGFCLNCTALVRRHTSGADAGSFEVSVAQGTRTVSAVPFTIMAP